jgi:tRNA nucleotidyltransferase (CCA-adding enzyme)
MRDFEWLMDAAPGDTLRALYESGALLRDLPEVHYLYGVPQRAEHHPEVDTGAHIELCLNVAAALNLPLPARFAVLMHDLGKGITDPATWPAHVDHEMTGVPLVRDVCKRFGVPEDWRKLAENVCQMHLQVHTSLSLRPQTILKLVDGNGLADPVVCENFLGACEADARGRLGRHDAPYPQGVYLREAVAAMAQLVNPGDDQGSPEWQDLHRIRLTAVKAVRDKHTGKSAAPAVICT